MTSLYCNIFVNILQINKFHQTVSACLQKLISIPIDFFQMYETPELFMIEKMNFDNCQNQILSNLFSSAYTLNSVNFHSYDKK